MLYLTCHESNCNCQLSYELYNYILWNGHIIFITKRNGVASNFENKVHVLYVA